MEEEMVGVMRREGEESGMDEEDGGWMRRERVSKDKEGRGRWGADEEREGKEGGGGWGERVRGG